MTREELLKLERKIKARKTLIEKIINFVDQIVQKFGEETYFSEGNSYTRIKMELKDVKGFTFKTDYGHTMFGGDDIEIYYKGEWVCKIYWQNDREVQRFEKGSWLIELQKLMSSPKNLVKYLEEQKQQKEQAKKKQVANAVDEKNIQLRSEQALKDAKRLGLTAE